jgi:hypothetical protein
LIGIIGIMKIHAQEDKTYMLLEHSFQFSPTLIAIDIANAVISEGEVFGTKIPYQISADVEYQYIPNYYFGFSLVSQFGIEITPEINFSGKSGNSNITGGMFGISPGIMIMPFGTKTKGLYTALYPSFVYDINTPVEDDTQQSIKFGLGIVFGHQWKRDTNAYGAFTMSAGFGASLSYKYEFNDSVTNMLSLTQLSLSDLLRDSNGQPIIKKPFVLDLQIYFRIGYAFEGLRYRNSLF